MGVSSTSFHEPVERLSETTLEHRRAVHTIIEELEAVDWYQQRVDAAEDEDLKAILAHNRDEEKEHAAMAIEWLRRKDPAFDAELRQYLFTEGPISELEDGGSEGNEAGAGGGGDGSLGIGDLRETS